MIASLSAPVRRETATSADEYERYNTYVSIALSKPVSASEAVSPA
jgi:hypothetical protein